MEGAVLQLCLFQHVLQSTQKLQDLRLQDAWDQKRLQNGSTRNDLQHGEPWTRPNENAGANRHSLGAQALQLLKGGYIGDYLWIYGTTIGVIKVDTRSLDNGSHDSSFPSRQAADRALGFRILGKACRDNLQNLGV